MSKKYTKDQLQIVLSQQEHKFTRDEVEALTKGEGNIQTEYWADKILDNHKSWMDKPLKRAEASIHFVTKRQHFEEVSTINSSLVFLTETLLRKGIITQEDIDSISHTIFAEKSDSLCLECEIKDCKGDFPVKKVKDIFPDITGELGDKVIRCDNYKQIEKKGEC